MRTAQVDPTTVGYIECHGTGTSLGDPIEVQGLSKAFSELYKRQNKPPAETPHCGLGSVKTNIGHLETAAGIAGVLKALLAIKHQQIPANLHLEEVNPYINLKGTPFFIADKLTPWAAPKDANGATVGRRAGVSSFGFGGANAHVVLEEYTLRAGRRFGRSRGPAADRALREERRAPARLRASDAGVPGEARCRAGRPRLHAAGGEGRNAGADGRRRHQRSRAATEARAAARADGCRRRRA